MVMVLQVVATGCGNGVELVVRQCMAELPTGCSERVEETVVGVVHLIDLENRFQASLIETCIMGNEWDRTQPFVQARGLLLLRCLIGKEHIRQAFF